MRSDRHGWRAQVRPLWVLLVLLAALAVMALARTSPAYAAPRGAVTPTPHATAHPTAHPTARATTRPTAQPTARPTQTANPLTTPEPGSSGSAAEGLETYKRLGCIGCHALAAANSVAGFGPTHEHIATTAAQRIHTADYTGKATSAAGYIAESIVDPEAYVVEAYRKMRYRMPKYTTITAAEVEDLVAFLMHQK